MCWNRFDPERRINMSREEAASVYLKALPGFRGDYLRFREAAKMLTDSDRALLQHAVSVGRERLMHSRGGSFFVPRN